MVTQAQFIENTNRFKAQWFGPSNKDVLNKLAEQSPILEDAIGPISGDRSAFVKALAEAMPKGPYPRPKLGNPTAQACRDFIKWFQVLVKQFYQTINHPSYKKDLPEQESTIKAMIKNSLEFIVDLVNSYSARQFLIKRSINKELNSTCVTVSCQDDEGSTVKKNISYKNAALNLVAS